MPVIEFAVIVVVAEEVEHVGGSMDGNGSRNQRHVGRKVGVAVGFYCRFAFARFWNSSALSVGIDVVDVHGGAAGAFLASHYSQHIDIRKIQPAEVAHRNIERNPFVEFVFLRKIVPYTARYCFVPVAYQIDAEFAYSVVRRRVYVKVQFVGAFQVAASERYLCVVLGRAGRQAVDKQNVLVSDIVKRSDNSLGGFELITVPVGILRLELKLRRVGIGKY